MLAAPCPRDCALPPPEARLSSARPRVPARTNFLRVAGPTRPASLARLGVTDASETDFPLFQRKGELARAPQPWALPAAPTRSCHSQRSPSPARPRRGRGGCRRLATCTFETKQTHPSRAQPSRGQGRPSPGVGSWRAEPPKRAPSELPLGRWDSPLSPPPQHTGVGTHKHNRAHYTHNRTRQDDAPSPARPRKRNFPSCPRAPRPHLSPACAPH